MTGHAEQCVHRYLELAKTDRKSFKKDVTPCVGDHQFAAKDLECNGILGLVASKVVLKVFYLTRMGRPDLLWTVNDPARNNT